MRTLKVGEKVYVERTWGYISGTVMKVTPKGFVDVVTGFSNESIRFNPSGRQVGQNGYLCDLLFDEKRHLVVRPYSIENLHKAAKIMKIARCWFHKNHYDVPKGMVAHLEEAVEFSVEDDDGGHTSGFFQKVSPREILKTIQEGQ
jgi:hypothetical protein